MAGSRQGSGSDCSIRWDFEGGDCHQARWFLGCGTYGERASWHNQDGCGDDRSQNEDSTRRRRTKGGWRGNEGAEVSDTTTLNGQAMARSLRPVMTEEAAASERDRTLTPRVVDALWSSGLMHWYNPAEAGGQEPTFAEMIETWIELAWQDGSLGWIGIANIPPAAASAAYLPDDGFKEVFVEHDNRVTMGGQFFPNGLGEDTGDAYRLTGAWNFGSGTGHSQYVAAGFIPTVDGEMVAGDDGIPHLLVAIIPHAEITFTDGWHVQGLKGTGS